jgi:predicted nucleic acid-binding protein
VAGRIFLDTNVLLHSISRAADEATKRDRAIRLLAARALGCDELYTEDLSHGRVIDGVIIDPFI